jgi:hypothetical protein
MIQHLYLVQCARVERRNNKWQKKFLDWQDDDDDDDDDDGCSCRGYPKRRDMNVWKKVIPPPLPFPTTPPPREKKKKRVEKKRT